MAELLKGKDVALAINEQNKQRVDTLVSKGITPTLALFRVGERADDLSYEKGATKRAIEAGVTIKNYIFDKDVSIDTFYSKIIEANNDNSIHGILIFRPLEKRFDDEFVRNLIKAEKDVDGCGNASLAGVFTNTKVGFAPCTAEAAIEVLKYYSIDVKGKNVCVLGRSLVVGKPVSILLMNQNATVTTCHTKTIAPNEIAKKSEILVCATGQMESVDESYVNKDQIVIDVGISWNEAKQKLCGDVDFEQVEPIVKAITPVPGGVGAITTSILIRHVIEAAEKTIQ